MKKRMVFFILAFLAVLVFSSEIYPKEKLVIEKFRKFMNAELRSWDVPGAAVGIMHNGYIIFAEGFGSRDIETKSPVTRYTLFPIGSSSKAFTSFVIGKLADEKVLGWEDPVKKHLPDFEMYDPWVTEHFRVADLLLHHSGLPRADEIWYGKEKSRDVLFRELGKIKNNREFRTVFEYQNLMYMTAGYLAGKASDSTWEDLVKKYIFSPLDMSASNFSIEASEKTGNYALSYAEKEGKTIRVPFYRDMAGIGPAGSINSNIYDMLKWVKLQLDGGKWNGSELISKENLKIIHSPHVIAGGKIVRIFDHFDEISHTAYGMGWFINHYRGNRLIHHGGNIDGFSALVTFMPGIEAGVVILTNKGSSLLTYSTAFHIYDLLLGKKPADWSARLKQALENIKKAENGDSGKK